MEEPLSTDSSQELSILGTNLTATNASVTSLNQIWDQARQECSPVARREASKSTCLKKGLVDRTVPAELTNKLARVMEVVSGVEAKQELVIFGFMVREDKD